ncbi:MAG TPA: helix-turn-helix domain-containing protein [Firmicutes bacterium]|nr:helix-turn-helix domain-containing protein [Bacillota bacterium]
MGRKRSKTSEMDVAEKQKTPLAKRLSKLITDGNELKDFLGVSAQAINQYKLGLSRPSLENICKIADFYGVSTDYLLGRTDTPSIEEDTQTASKTTGLSEDSIVFLQGKQDIMWLINGMLEHPVFHAILSQFRDYILLAERDTDYLRILDGVPGSLVSRNSLHVTDILDESSQNKLKDNGYSVAPASLVAQSILYDVNFSLRQVLNSIAIRRGENNGQHQTK